MQDYGPLPSFSAERISLTKFPIRVQHHIPKQFMSAVEISEHKDMALDGLILQLDAYLLGKESSEQLPPAVTKTQSRRVDAVTPVPRTWWDHLKRTFVLWVVYKKKMDFVFTQERCWRHRRCQFIRLPSSETEDIEEVCQEYTTITVNQTIVQRHVCPHLEYYSDRNNKSMHIEFMLQKTDRPMRY